MNILLVMVGVGALIFVIVLTILGAVGNGMVNSLAKSRARADGEDHCTNCESRFRWNPQTQEYLGVSRAWNTVQPSAKRGYVAASRRAEVAKLQRRT